jgi:hypothetical protein
MALGRGSQRGLRFIEEVTVGVTPATNMTTLRNTGDSITLTKDSFQSNELRSDRAVTDLTMGNKQTGGGIDYELSVDNFDPFLAAALYSTGTDLLAGIENGVTERSFTIEKSFPNIPIYEVYTGIHVNTLTLNVAANSQITGSMDLLGTGYTTPIPIIPLVNATDAAVTGGLFDSHNLVIREGGVPIGIGLSLTLNINNNLNAAFALGDDEAIEVIDGRCSVDGTLQIYFDSKDIYEKFANDTESSIELDLISTKAGVVTTYTFELPRVKYTTADDPVSDEGAVNVSMAFMALQDDSAGYTIKISKTVV